MSKPRTENLLCEQCSTLDYSPYRYRDLTGPEQNTDDDSGHESKLTEVRGDISIGHQLRDALPRYEVYRPQDIASRKDTCVLCSMITNHMAKCAVEDDEQIELYTARFCDSFDENGAGHQTVRLYVLATPPVAPFFGPVDAYQIESSRKKSRNILELQECCTDIPLADDETSETLYATSTRLSGRLVGPKVNLHLVSKWVQLCETRHNDGQ